MDIYGVTIQVAQHSIKQVRVIAIPNHAEEPIVGRNVLNALRLHVDGPDALLHLEV